MVDVFKHKTPTERQLWYKKKNIGLKFKHSVDYHLYDSGNLASPPAS